MTAPTADLVHPLSTASHMRCPVLVIGGSDEIAWTDASVHAVPSSVSAVPRDRDEALTLLFSTCYPRLLGLARLVAEDGASAEDLVQDAFASLHRRWRSVRDPQAALAYLQRSIVNGARNQARGRAVRDRFLRVRSAPTAVPEPADHAVESEERRDVVAALRRLPVRQRQVLVLRYYLDRSEAEIAAALSISAGSVKQHASRGLAALARAMGVDP